MADIDLTEDIAHAFEIDADFLRDWRAYELRNRMSNEAYERLSPTIDMRYGT